MKKMISHSWLLSGVLLLMVLGLPDSARADIINVAEGKAVSVFKAVRGIIFIVGGFGLVTLAFFAIFGKLKWTWFASLAVGLAILAAAGAIIDYATTSTGGTVGSQLGDTLTGGGDSRR